MGRGGSSAQTVMEASRTVALDHEQRQQVKDVLCRWAAVHPDPDKPLITWISGEDTTPRQLSEALQSDSATAQRIYTVFARNLIADDFDPEPSLNEILDDFETDALLWIEAEIDEE